MNSSRGEDDDMDPADVVPGLPRSAGGELGMGRLPPLGVLIIDDHQLFAEVISSTLEFMGARVLDIAMTAEQGLAAARRHRPDLVLVDIGLPDESGLALGSKILAELPETRLVAVTALHDAQAVAEALRIGFQGYVTKDTPVRQFLTTIVAVMDGQVVVPKHLARRAAGARTQYEAQVALVVDQLTEREREVLTQLARGASTVQISRALAVSPNTIRTHTQNILTKLGVHSRLEAVAFAIRHGIVRAPESRRAEAYPSG
jgi:DNA-binding NarL/FixJ family response regulator